MNDDLVLFDSRDGVARLTLNRPANGNAIDPAMTRALLAVAIRCDEDPAIRCVVLTGAGRMFCSGGDIGLFAQAREGAPEVLEEMATTLHLAVSRFARMGKPMLALVNGPAAGAGLSLALAGDIVLAARSASFMTAYGSIGLTPDGGMTWLLPRLIGLRKTQEMLLANRRVSADEAEAMGLITRAVDDERLAEEGEQMVDALVRAPTAALGAARSLLLGSFSAELETQLAREAESIIRAGAMPESREGITAFLEKRPPDFGGV